MSENKTPGDSARQCAERQFLMFLILADPDHSTPPRWGRNSLLGGGGSCAFLHWLDRTGAWKSAEMSWPLRPLSPTPGNLLNYISPGESRIILNFNDHSLRAHNSRQPESGSLELLFEGDPSLRTVERKLLLERTPAFSALLQWKGVQDVQCCALW